MEWLTGYAVFHWIATWATPFGDVFFRAVTDLGSPTFYYIVIAPLFWAVDRRRAAVLFLLLLAAGYVNTVAKIWVNTPRPDPLLARVLDLRPYEAHSNAFPSGHAQMALVFFGYLAWWIQRRWATVAAIVIVGLISLSRLYLGVHFPIDIVGGLTLGAVMMPLVRPLDRWAATGCYTPNMARLAVVIVTLAIALTGDPALAVISGSVVGYLAGASWLPQQPLVLDSTVRAVGVVIIGVALQFGLAATIPAVGGYALFIYFHIAALWIFALWIYPRMLNAVWLRPALAQVES